MKPTTVKLGKFDSAIVIRCRTMDGPVQHELIIPEGEGDKPMPLSVRDILRCAAMLGDEPIGVELRKLADQWIDRQ